MKNATLAGQMLTVNGPADGRLEGAFDSAVINSQLGKDVRLTLKRLKLGPAVSALAFG